MSKLRWFSHNLLLIIRAYGRAAIFGWSRKQPALPPKKVLIVQGSRIGDMVCTTPVFRALKRQFPEVKILVAGDSINEKLLFGHPDVHKYFVWKNNSSLLARELRNEKIDFGILPLPSADGLALMFAARIPSVVAPKIIGGKAPYETITYKILRFLAIAAPHHNFSYVPREYLRLLEPLGIVTEDATKSLSFARDALETLKLLLAAEGIDLDKEKPIGIVPSVGGDPIKRFAPEKFARIADYVFKKHNLPVVLIGAGRDKADVEFTASKISKSVRFASLLDKLSIEELKALIASLKILISADTGPIYIAEAFKIPTIDIVGPVDEKVQPPIGKFHRVVVPERKEAAMGVIDNIPEDSKEAIRQSESISAEMVFPVIDELISLIR